MEKILIIGCSGSGKSTLAVALGEKLGLPVVHLDQLWWKEGWRNATPLSIWILTAGRACGGCASGCSAITGRRVPTWHRAARNGSIRPL